MNLLLFSYYNDFCQVGCNEFFQHLEMTLRFDLSTKIFGGVQERFSCFFSGLSQRKRNLLTQHFECRVYMPGELVLKGKQSSPGIWFIVSGSVRLNKISGQFAPRDPENEVTVVVLTQGSYFGEDFLVGRRPMFNVVNGDTILKALFIKSKYVNFINETEFQRDALRYLYTNTFKRRVYHQIVTASLSQSFPSALVVLVDR